MKKKLILAAAFLFVVVSAATAQEEYKYNYKYGSNQYNYDVEGYGDDGYVSGNVDTNGKDVEGYITTDEGDEVHFEGEFTDYGKIEGYDEDGNYYELETE